MAPSPLPHPRRGARAVQVAAVTAAVLGLLVLTRDTTYRAATSWADGLPGWAEVATRASAEVGLLALVVAYGVALRRARSRDWHRVGIGLVAGVAVALAWASSEALKALVREVRPCRALDQVGTLAACPPAGDWSWPSSHATLAAALATATVLVAPRLWRLVVPLAVLVALARVAVGVHHLHDVVSGLVLGGVVVAVLTLRLGPTAIRLASGRLGRWGTDRLPRMLGRPDPLPRPRPVPRLGDASSDLPTGSWRS